MDNLRIVLIVVASLVIIALLIHGFWINKKERSSLFNSDKRKKNQQNAQQYENSYIDDIEEDDVILITPKNKKNSESVDKNTPDELVQETMPKQEDLFVNNHHQEPTTQDPAPKEPNISMNHDLFDDEPLKTEANVSIEKADAKRGDKIQPATQKTKPEKLNINKNDEDKTEIIILNIKGINGKLLQGDVLLGSIMQSGFQFGDMRIFHRHVDPAGNGPILFSLANMVNPGYLDPETMHEFTTPGVSIFMVAPTQGNNQQNFKLMLQTAQRIADDVNGVVLDDEHHMLTPQKIDSYKERIKKACNEI
ncbi:cell division protein ZipA [Gilliamella sp. B3464]|nr:MULTISPECIES: cell division protein ZipA [unclassified Gilliamella]MCX8710946.1 cell division protein ZipA [Gilliamella sp. B3468]MCX8749996.1 cell division protein ZipA [Gilliamella sp. B3464]